MTSSHRHVCLSSGTLQNRSLTNVVRKEDLVVSEYLTTLLVFVPRSGTPRLFCSSITSLGVCLYEKVDFFWFLWDYLQEELLSLGKHLRMSV